MYRYVVASGPVFELADFLIELVVLGLQDLDPLIHPLTSMALCPWAQCPCHA